MASDISSLDERLDRVADRLTAGVEGLFADLIAFTGAALVITTPVDTGFARGNWRPSLNTPSPTPISTLDPSGQATISRIETVGKLWRVGDTAYIVNRAPYIGRLNQGSSPQAPAGFVQAALQDGLREAFQSRVFIGTGVF
ncbi:MAG: hypothetical protein WBG86_06275 [Polyangiales bacterium]